MFLFGVRLFIVPDDIGTYIYAGFVLSYEATLRTPYFYPAIKDLLVPA
jgi:hypothetical protein